MEISKLKIIDFSNVSTEAERIELIQNNVVKIINNIDNENKIVGTGFFIDDGYLVTNSHIVDIEGNITIEYPDNSIDTAKIISNDISSDIAILTVNNPKVSALIFANTLNLKVTEDLYTIGYTLNLSGKASVTKGILSARRSAGGIEYLQTDAAIDNGSSCSPLVNINGEVVGMNSLANDNSTIGMAISSESLQNVLYKIKTNKEITYIDNERPQNALSNVLFEVEYDITDIYNEHKFLNKSDKDTNDITNNNNGNNSNNSNNNNSNNNNNNNNNNSNQKPNISNDSKLQTLIIDNYKFQFDKYLHSYEITLLNNESSLSITAIPNDSKAKYEIKGNSELIEGENKIEIIVTAESGKKEIYTINVIKPLTEFEGVAGINCGLNTEKNPTNGINSFHMFCDYEDTDKIRIYSNYPLNILNSAILKVYAGWDNNDGIYTETRLLKTYNYTPTIDQKHYYVPINEIRELLTEDDYEGGLYEGADLTFEITLNTKKQGSFTDRNPWGLEKK